MCIRDRFIPFSRRIILSRTMQSMKLCRFKVGPGSDIRIGLVIDDLNVLDLTSAGVQRMGPLLKRSDLHDELRRLSTAGLAQHSMDSVRLLTPVEGQEV